MEIQKRYGGDLSQNGGNEVVSSHQTLEVGPLGFALDQMWGVRKKRRAKNVTKVFDLNNWKMGLLLTETGSLRKECLYLGVGLVQGWREYQLLM